MEFADRADAGRRLAGRLGGLRAEDVVVLGLPRGGVPVAFEVARELRAPLDVIVVRKLGVPFQPELAMGAIGEDGVLIVNEEIVRHTGLGESDLAAAQRREEAELEARVERFRRGMPRVELRDRTAVVVDDGVATGATARAACQVARAHGARRVVLAVPVGSPDTMADLRRVADEVVCLQEPELFFAVGQWYQEFGQTSDAEVVELLERAAMASSHARRGPAGPGRGGPAGRPGDDPPDPPGAGLRKDPPGPPALDEEVWIDGGFVELTGHLTVPAQATGVVAFAHGSGSSRHSPRNRQVAAGLNRAGLGTLLFDLLTTREELDRGNVFDIGLLADRLVAATAWLRGRPETAGVRVGYFGASTGAAAALWAAAEPGADIAAVVSRGGRPDLADRRLGDVRAPTLLLVGGEDRQVLGLNRRAQERLRCQNQLTVVPGATHLFEEPGALEAVTAHARDWFLAYMR
ncbi:phosphoribosyltransferase family protein [Actinomadura sp. NPDC000600]|uniref:phosphoribosyltransferase family protein n=1 Tax=Actinomadura sp. NPDC000600 TaxID=3154262 RepID=UPI0033939CE2